jgi:hypothetical protein
MDLELNLANASEAAEIRDQGKTFLVFTIFTIVFVGVLIPTFHKTFYQMLQLPLSFMTAFLVINIEEFPKDSSGATSLPLRYICKYLCKSYHFLLACLGTHDAPSWNLGGCICALHHSCLLRTCSPPMDQNFDREDTIPFLGVKAGDSSAA